MRNGSNLCAERRSPRQTGAIPTISAAAAAGRDGAPRNPEALRTRVGAQGIHQDPDLLVDPLEGPSHVQASRRARISWPSG